MELRWFKKMEPDQRALFIRHLKLQCHRQRLFGKEQFVFSVGIPILEALHSGQDSVEPDLDTVQAAESRGFRLSQLEPTLESEHADFLTPLDTREAAKYMGGLSIRRVQEELRSLCGMNEDAVKISGQWQVPVVVLDDWLIKRSQLRL